MNAFAFLKECLSSCFLSVLTLLSLPKLRLHRRKVPLMDPGSMDGSSSGSKDIDETGGP